MVDLVTELQTTERLYRTGQGQQWGYSMRENRTEDVGYVPTRQEEAIKRFRELTDLSKRLNG